LSEDFSSCVIGLDRDGVINRDLGTYCYRVKDFEPIDGSIEAIASLRRKGFKIVILTDQGGIEKGIYTQSQVDIVHAYLLELLKQVGCDSIDGVYNSTSTRPDDPLAKPNIGMFMLAEKEINHIKFNQGYYVGDKIRDLEAAVTMGARPVLVRTGYGSATEKALAQPMHDDLKCKTIVFDNLASFVKTL